MIREKAPRIRAFSLFPIGLIGNGQLGATLGAAAGQNLTSVRCLHAFTESMNCFATAGMGLECAFHCPFFNYLPLIIREFTANNQVNPGPLVVREGKAKEFQCYCQQ